MLKLQIIKKYITSHSHLFIFSQTNDHHMLIYVTKHTSETVRLPFYLFANTVENQK